MNVSSSLSFTATRHVAAKTDKRRRFGRPSKLSSIANLTVAITVTATVTVTSRMGENQVSVHSIVISVTMYNWPARNGRGSSVGKPTGYVLGDLGEGIRVPVESRIFTSPNGLGRLWGPPNLLSNGYRGHFLWGKAAGA
jgi:hypothetical protein